MHNSLKFGLIASVMMVIPGVANAQLGGLGGLVGGIVETVDSLLGGSSSSSSAASSSDGLEVEVPGVVDVCIGAACPGGEAIGVEVTVPGVGDVDACVGEACGNNALNLPVCVDALGNAILGCGDNPNPPPGPNPGPLPPVLCVDILGQPIIGVGCPPRR